MTTTRREHTLSSRTIKPVLFLSLALLLPLGPVSSSAGEEDTLAALVQTALE
jgi:fumarate reductase subunit D